MEPNIEVFCKKDEYKRKDCTCLWIVLSLVAVALSFFVGVLVSALTGIVDTISVGGIIALVVILSILLVIAIINVICCIKNAYKKNCC